MTKMKTLVFALTVLFFSSASTAQTIDEGKKFLYYERFKSAKEVFQKLSAASPANDEYSYYLGQAMIGLQDIAGAKALYQQKSLATPNSPLTLAGMGHIGLLEGNTADARSRFETAINLSGGKRIDVLNAVGVANSNPDNKNGDAAYAIDKLNLATTLKGFKDPEVFTNLGDAYRKNNDGSNAAKSYQSALELNPNYARAIYRTGRLYQSQGESQRNLFLSLYDQAIAKDANFAPVYNTLFNYYYNTDVSKSAINMEKWLTLSDDDGMACYYRASMKFAQGLNSDVIAKCNECLSTPNAPANLYGLKAFAQLKSNDSTGAKSSFEEFFKKQTPSKIGAGDYSSYAVTLLKFPGNESLAATYIDKAVAIDTTEANKVAYLKVMANAYRKINDFNSSAAWFNRVLNVKKNYNNLDLYNAGFDYLRVNKFDSSIMVFDKYTAKYPDDMFGFYMAARAASALDSLMTTGQAATAHLKAIEVGEKAADKSKVKDNLMASYQFMLQYAFNIKKDQAMAISYADKALALDPMDAQSIKNKEFVTKNSPSTKAPAKPKAPVKAAAPAKPSTTTKTVAKPTAKLVLPKKK